MGITDDNYLVPMVCQAQELQEVDAIITQFCE